MPFLAFEGLDGSGKSTLMARVCQELDAHKKSYVQSREPGGTPLAEEIRNLILRKGAEVPFPRTELLLYEASRAQHVDQVLKPALASGKWVIFDRYAASTVSFQCFARGVSRKNVDWLNHFATDGMDPDFYILLDLPVDVALSRLKGRESFDRMESEKVDFHQRVRDGYLAQAKENPSKWIVLNGEDAPDKLFKTLWEKLRGLL